MMPTHDDLSVQQRQKLGLSATNMGRLIGVSGQSIYHWESGKTRPRQQQLQAIAALRKVGKREAKRMLNDLSTTQDQQG